MIAISYSTAFSVRCFLAHWLRTHGEFCAVRIGIQISEVSAAWKRWAHLLVRDGLYGVPLEMRLTVCGRGKRWRNCCDFRYDTVTLILE